MSKHTYGVAPSGNYTDVSKTLLGAKQWATRNGFDKVFIRFNCGYHVALKATKVSGKWLDE